MTGKSRKQLCYPIVCSKKRRTVVLKTPEFVVASRHGQEFPFQPPDTGNNVHVELDGKSIKIDDKNLRFERCTRLQIV